MSSDSDALHKYRELIYLQHKYIENLESEREDLRSSISALAAMNFEQSNLIGRIVDGVVGLSPQMNKIKREVDSGIALIIADPLTASVN